MKFVFILFVCFWLALINVSSSAAGHHEPKKSHKGASGGGFEKTGSHYAEHKHVKGGDKVSKHDKEEAHKGDDLKEKHRIEHETGGGKKTVHGSEGHHKSHENSGGGGEHEAKFSEGKHEKKSSFKKGFREKYHKNEEKKHDSYYSKGQKSGNFEMFGDNHSKYHSHHGGKKKVDNYKKVEDKGEYGTKKEKAGGHDEKDQKGHDAEKSSESHHEHHTHYAKKGGSQGGKQYKIKAHH